MKRKLWLILFYILSFTWGLPATLIGLILMILPFGKMHKYHERIYKTISKGWGGVSFGCFFLCGEDCQEDYIQSHECGHGLQNIIWGPLYLFVIEIPSATRYWYREYLLKHNREKYFTLPEYDAVWFEAQATMWGEKYIETDKL